MTDVFKTIAPKSDQMNADDLIGCTKTITVTKVSLLAGEQPIAINYEGDNGKPYKPCKSMRRVLVQIWGGDGAAYVGRSMTLYRDDKVRFGADEVGGIRISHLSHIKEPVTIALTASRAKRKPFVVKPLDMGKVVAHAQHTEAPEHPGGVEYISPDQGIVLDDILKGHADVRADIVKMFGSLAKIPAGKYAKLLVRAKELCGVTE